jgi:hypothetical protein
MRAKLILLYRFVAIFFYNQYVIWRDAIITKLLALTFIGVAAAFALHHYVPHAPGIALAAVVIVCVVGAVVAGYIQFYQNENNIIKRTVLAFKDPPLCHFIAHGFEVRFEEQLWGMVNNYLVILNPSHGNIMNFLTITIPLQTVEIDTGTLTPLFNLVEESGALLAIADIEYYNEKYNYYELMNLITDVTAKLQESNLQPIDIS